MMNVDSLAMNRNCDNNEMDEHDGEGASNLYKVRHIHTVMWKIASFLTMGEWSKLMLATGGRMFRLFCCKRVRFRIPKSRDCPTNPDRCITPFKQQRYYDWETEEFFEDITVHQDRIDPSSKYVTGFIHKKDIHSELCRCTNRFQNVQKAERDWKRGHGFKQVINITVPNRAVDFDIITL